MKTKPVIRFCILFSVFLSVKYSFAQLPSCPSNIIYMVTGTTIYNFNPALPVSASNPSVNSISLPPGATQCLAVSNNLNAAGPSPTFYTIVSGIYYYHNGVSWVSTGHSAGGPASVNPGGSGNFIYNLDINSNVYKYNGTGNSTFLTAVNWSPGGPVDVIGDDCGNFYILKTAAPQVMTIYNPSGAVIGTYTMTGMPNVSNGGGFAIVGNKTYVHNSNGFYVGTIVGNSINFVSSTNPMPGGTGDFGSCQFPPITMQATTIGSISCASTTASVVVNTTVSPVTYSWTGPGIVGSTTSSLAIVNTPGMYTCVVTPTSGCSSMVTTSVSLSASSLTPTFAVSNSLTCLTSTAQISVSPNSGPYSYTWTGPGILNGAGTPSIIANAVGSYSVLITNTVTSCSGSGTVNLASALATLTMSANSESVCIGQNKTLTVTSNGATSYSWSPSNTLSQSTGSMVIANPTVTTNYTITGSVATCTAITVVTVTVVQPPTVSVSPSSASVCAGGPGAVFTAFGASTYSWSPANSLNASSGATVTASPTVVTIYTVVGTSNTCTNSATFTVSLNPSLTITVSPTVSNICSGSSVQITATGANTYSWTNSSGLSATSGSLVTASPPVTTIYTVTGSSGTCLGTEVFTVNVIPTPTVSISASTLTICDGNSTVLSVSGADSYSWSPSTGLNNTTGNSTIASPNTNITYSVVGTNTLNPACFDSETIHIIVYPKITGTVNPNSEICIGKTTLLGAYGGNTTHWYPAASLSNTNSPTPIASPTITTTYTVFISNSGLCPDSQIVTVQVNPLPNVNAGLDTTLAYGDSLLLIGNGQGLIEWVGGNYFNCNHCSQIYIYPENTDCYLLQATSNKGCINTDEVCITVNKEYGIFIPNSFTPNNDGLNEVFYIEGFGIRSSQLEVFDRWGNLIFVSSETMKGWDGKYKNVRVKNDVYVYKAIITTITNQVIEKVGHVTLLGK